MSGLDNEVFNLLERAESADVNDAQSMIARFLSEMSRYGFASKRVADPTAEQVGSFVLGGLIAQPSGADVVLSAGVMGQLSLTLPPVPGALDSPYRLSRSQAPILVTMPAPGFTTYYLIEAQMDEVTTLSQVRDVWTPPSGPFVPTLVPKQTERRIQTQVVAGAAPNAPNPSGGDWVPIAIVRRPGGGGPVAASDIIDVRPLLSDRLPPMVCRERRSIVTTLAAGNTLDLLAEMNGPGGKRAARGAALDVTAAAVLSPSTVLAANTAFHLYLAPWSAFSLAPRQFGALQFEGVLVLSSVTPSADGTNSALLDLPPPFAVSQAAIGSAYHVGTLARNSANTGWVYQRTGDSKTVLANYAFAATGAPALGDFPLNLYPVPPTARSVDLEVLHDGTGAALSTTTINLQDTGSAVNLRSWLTYDDRATRLVTEVPFNPTTGMDLNYSAPAPAAAAIFQVRLLGYSE